MSKQLCLGKNPNGSFVLCWDNNGSIEPVKSEMIPARAMLETLIGVNDSIEESGKEIKRTEAAVKHATENTPYCSKILLTETTTPVYSMTVANSDGKITIDAMEARNMEIYNKEQTEHLSKVIDGIAECFNVYFTELKAQMKKDIEAELKRENATTNVAA